MHSNASWRPRNDELEYMHCEISQHFANPRFLTTGPVHSPIHPNKQRKMRINAHHPNNRRQIEQSFTKYIGKRDATYQGEAKKTKTEVSNKT